MTASSDRAAATARELADDRRIARARRAVGAAIEQVCEAEPDMTYGDVVDALTGVAHRYAQHFRRTDAVPIALPADRELYPLAPGVGPDGLYDTERAPLHARPGDALDVTVYMPAGLPAGVTVHVVDQHRRPIATGATADAGAITWTHLEPPAGNAVQISAVLPLTLGAAGTAALALVAERLAGDAAGDLVLIAADVPAGDVLPGEEVIVTGDHTAASGFAVAIRPAPDAVAANGDGYGERVTYADQGVPIDPSMFGAAVVAAWAAEPPPDPDGPIAAGLCGRCGSPDHRKPACDADDFTAAAWLGKD